MADKLICPKCKHAMDEGRVSPSGSGIFGYVSEKQTGMLRQVTPVDRGRACPNCGYVELFLDPAELKKRIG
jgi:predicted nucleic-acid-binding Zn-ribbon protein